MDAVRFGNMTYSRVADAGECVLVEVDRIAKARKHPLAHGRVPASGRLSPHFRVVRRTLIESLRLVRVFNPPI